MGKGTIQRSLRLIVAVNVGWLASGWVGCARRDEQPVSRAPVTDLLPIDRARAVAVRSEPARAVLELVDLAQGVRWRAAVPPFAGSPQRPGLAASSTVVHVRVVSDGHADLIALDARSGKRLTTVRLSAGWPPSEAGWSLPRAMSVAGDGRSYQLLGDERRGAVVAVSLAGGKILWRHEVEGRIDLAVAAGPDLSLVVDGRLQRLDGETGAPDGSAAGGEVKVGASGGGIYSLTSDLAPLLAPGTPPRIPPVELTFDPAARSLLALEPATGRRLGAIAWPPGALTPEPHHYKEGALWVVLPRGLAALDARTLRMTPAVRAQ